MIKFCQNCGKEYSIPKSQEGRSKFCSDKCFRESKNTQNIYYCDYCHKPFMVRQSKINKRINGLSKSLCCSTECARNIQKPDWSIICNEFQNRGYILKSKVYINSSSKLEYVCQKHDDKGSQFITYNNLKNGYGCKYCGIERVGEHRRLDLNEVKNIFAKNNMKLIDGQEYHNTSQLMAYICLNHQEQGVQYMTTSNAYRNHCPYCHQSKGEDKISKFLLSHQIDFISQYKLDDLVGIKGKPLSYDFYLPNQNLLIEYQGEFHDGSTRGLQTHQEFIIQQEHDRRKREYARSHHIKLLEIWYYDFINIEDILSDFITTQ